MKAYIIMILRIICLKSNYGSKNKFIYIAFMGLAGFSKDFPALAELRWFSGTLAGLADRMFLRFSRLRPKN